MGQGIARQRPVHIKAGLAKPHLAHHPVRKAEFAVGASTQAQVVAKLPIVQVVPAAVPVARIGRHLVTVQAGGAGQVGDQVQHVTGAVLIGQRGRVLGKDGVGLDRQVIQRQVRWRQSQRGAQVSGQVRQRLPRQRIHQVQVEGVKRLGRLFYRRQCLGPVMHPAQRAQKTIVETLHSDRQSRHASGAKGAKAVPLKGTGVGFQGDLAVGRQP